MKGISHAEERKNIIQYLFNPTTSHLWTTIFFRFKYFVINPRIFFLIGMMGSGGGLIIRIHYIEISNKFSFENIPKYIILNFV